MTGESHRHDLVEPLGDIPAGVDHHTWTIRDDNQHHYHSTVNSAESPFYLRLLWRATERYQVRTVGCYRLDLRGLLASGFIRREESEGARGDLRVRFVSEDRRIYLRVNRDKPPLLVGQVK